MSSVIPWFEVPTIGVAGALVDLPAVLAVAGALLALAMARYGAHRAGLSSRRAVDMLALTMLSALLCGRLTEVLYYPDHLASDWRILLPWRGGYTSLGVLVGGGLAAALLLRRLDLTSRWRYGDVLVRAVLVGGAVVRVGCFVGHHHAGRLTTLPLAVAYPGGPRFDLGLCEATLLLAVFAGGSRRGSAPGRIAAASIIAYALGRFAIEFLRGSDLELIGRRSDPRYLGLTLVQYATLAIAVLGFTWLWRQRTRATRPA